MGNIRWRGYDHPAMYDMINSGPGASASTPVTTYWESLSKDLDKINTDLNDGLKKLNVGWEGQAAQSAQSGLNPLQQWSSDAQLGSDVMKISSVDQAQYVSTARNQMPKPVQVTTPAPTTWDKVKAGAASAIGVDGPANQVAQQSADHEAQETAQQAAAQKAVQTMESYQSSSEWNRNSLGTFVPAPDVVVSVNPETGGGVKHVQTRKQVTPNSDGNNVGTTHSAGFTGSPTTNSTGFNHVVTDVGHTTTTTTTTGTTVTTTPTTQTTTPNWAQPPTGPTTNNPVQHGPTTGPTTGPNLPSDTSNPNTRPGLPVTGPVGDPEAPIGKNPPGGRGPITGPGENVPGRGGLPPNQTGGTRGRTGLPRTGGGLPVEGDQVRNPNSRLRPGATPNAAERGARPGLGARGANAYAYGEEPGVRSGGGTGGVGGAGGRGGESSRPGNRYGRGGAGSGSAAAEEGRAGSRSGTRGAGGRLGQHENEEEDYEYQHADYLVDTEDVFLDDRLVAPPVIGERPGS